MLRTAIASTLLTTALTGAALADQPYTSDPTELTFQLAEDRNDVAKGITAKYHLRVHGRVHAAKGEITRADRVDVEWLAGGKKLTTASCDVDANGDSAQFNCEGTDQLDAFGDLTAVLKFTRDADDTVTTLSTHQLKVGRFWNWYMRNDKRLYYAQYQVMPLDLVTSAVISEEDWGSGDHRVQIYGWATTEGAKFPDAETLRCSVDGKRLADFDANGGDGSILEATDWRDPQVDPRVAHVNQFKIWIGGLTWGTSADVDPNRVAAGLVVMGDHPGQWSCDWRAKGKVLRTFTFAVGADGFAVPHAEQAAGLALPAGKKLIDVTLPESAADAYVDAAQSKAGGLWGQAWRLAATGAKLAPSFSRPGFETAPPAGAKAAGKPAKAKKRK